MREEEEEEEGTSTWSGSTREEDVAVRVSAELSDDVRVRHRISHRRCIPECEREEKRE